MKRYGQANHGGNDNQDINGGADVFGHTDRRFLEPGTDAVKGII